MPTFIVVFNTDVDEYKEGQEVELPRHLARRYIRGGQGSRVTKKKKVTRKKVTKKEFAEAKPEIIEQAIEE